MSTELVIALTTNEVAVTETTANEVVVSLTPTEAVLAAGADAVSLHGRALGDLSAIAVGQVLAWDGAAFVPDDGIGDGIDAADVISGTFADARIAESNVTQHQAALALSASQVTAGTFANARIAESNVTQHQAALSIAETQIPDGLLLARVGGAETITAQWTFSHSPRITPLTPKSVVFVGTSEELAEDTSRFVWDNTLKYLGLGTASPSSFLHVVGGTLPGDSQSKNFLNVSGTFPAGATTSVSGARLTFVSAGTHAFQQVTLDVMLSAGYTGTNRTAVIFATNEAAAPGTTGWTGAAANFGATLSVTGIGAGHNVGFHGFAQGSSTHNIGMLGRARSTVNTPALNVGVAGISLNATVNIGGYFSLRDGEPITPISAALLCDNSSTTSPMFVARDNGTVFFEIADGGSVRLGTNPATAGTLRLAHNMSVQGRNSANLLDASLLSWGAVANELIIGSASFVTRLRSSLATPGTLADGDWWVDCTGTSPSRVCAIKVRDGGATRTIASVTY